MLHVLTFLLFFTNWFMQPAATLRSVPAANATVADPEICRMFGTVYLTSDPAQKSFARYIVYIEPEAAYADLQVFKETNKLFADGPGLWYVTQSRNFADHIFFVTTNRAFADFSIHYTTVRTFAGCRN